MVPGIVTMTGIGTVRSTTKAPGFILGARRRSSSICLRTIGLSPGNTDRSHGGKFAATGETGRGRDFGVATVGIIIGKPIGYQLPHLGPVTTGRKGKTGELKTELVLKDEHKKTELVSKDSGTWVSNRETA
jgi:hypothetical protein